MDIAGIVHYVHLALLLLGIFIPFTNDKSWLVIYSLCIPFLFFHWSTNDDTCAITLAEQYTFVGQVMNGVYILPEDQMGKALKFIFFSLWLFVQYRLQRLFY